MVIQHVTIIASEKKDLESLIFLLFRVDKYLYVIKKFEQLIIDDSSVKTTTHKPMSVLPNNVYFGLDENGVIIAHPGIKSFAFFSTTHNKSEPLIYFLYKEC